MLTNGDVVRKRAAWVLTTPENVLCDSGSEPYIQPFRSTQSGVGETQSTSLQSVVVHHNPGAVPDRGGQSMTFPCPSMSSIFV